MPQPTANGVFGITRITACPGTSLCSLSRLTLPIMESTVVFCGIASATSLVMAASATCGFTARITKPAVLTASALQPVVLTL